MKQSFTLQIKEEITHLIFQDHCKRAILCSILKSIGILKISNNKTKLVLSLHSPTIIKFCYKLIQDLYGMKSKFSIIKKNRLNNSNMYTLEIDADPMGIYSDLHLDDINLIKKNIISSECCRRAFITGAFLTAGSINAPTSVFYHFEIQSFKKDYIDLLNQVFKTFEFQMKILKRRNNYVIYNKKSESISDLLKLMNCSTSVINFENVRMERDLTNQINRYNNLDFSNIKKAVNAAQKSSEVYKIVLKKMPDAFSEKEIKVLEFRFDNNEFSLSHIVKKFNSQNPKMPITKSLVNHYNRKIKTLYNKLDIKKRG